MGRFRWHTLFVAALTAGLLWLFFDNIDLEETWQAITHAHVGLIALAVLVVLMTYLIRAWRWQALLRPIGDAAFSTAFRTTVIGFTATFLLPARVGEILRPYLLARREGFKASSTFATVIVERLLDTCTVLLLFAFALPIAGAQVGSEVIALSVIAATAALGGLVVLFVLAGHPERLGRWTAALSSRLPERASRGLSQFVQTFAEGLKIMRSPGHLLLAACWSLPLWLSIALGILLTSWAFDLTLSLTGSFIVVGYLAVGVSAPTPGGAGGFHLAYQLAMTQFFGASESVAAAAAIVLHAVSFVPVSLVGLVFMWQDGLTLGGMKDIKTSGIG